MPSIATQYTPLESLLFLQSVARNGADSSTLSTISHSLTTNHFVLNGGTYDGQRLEPEGLRTLYDDLVKAEEDNTSPSVNGNNAGGASNPLKRKLSASPEPASRLNEKAQRASNVADRLYSRYRERMIHEIKAEEEEYQSLVADIKKLEDETKQLQRPIEPLIQNGFPPPGVPPSLTADQSASPAKDGPSPSGAPVGGSMLSRDPRSKEELAQSAEINPPHPPPGQMLPPQTPGLESPFPRSPSGVAAPQRQLTPGSRVSPAPPNGIPVQVQQQQQQQQQQNFPPRYPPMQSPLPLPSTTSPRSSNTLPPISSLVPQPPPPKGSSVPRKSYGAVPSRTSPLLPSPSPPYPQQSSYGYPYPAWPQYHSPNSPYANPQFYHHQPMTATLPPAQSPLYNQYSPYQHPAPLTQYAAGPHPHPPMPGPAPQYPQFPWPRQPAAATTTPSVQHSVDRPGVRISGTSTPWTPGGVRHGSPERPVRERDVSPLSDRATSPTETRNDTQGADRKTVPKETPPKEVPQRGRGPNLGAARAGSTHSSTLASRSRSQSLASITSELRPGRAIDIKPTTTVRKIKAEAPSTPAPFTFTSDSEQKSSSRDRRGRRHALPPPASDLGRTSSKRKRERESGTEPSPSPSLPLSLTPRAFGSRIRPRAEPIDPSLVALTKNFARMAAPILSDVNAHKLAGIFAKPVTERDAPGYRDLIHRPQDLKSIRAAVGRGSRAANGVLEEVESRVEEGEGDTAGVAVKTTTLTNMASGSVLVPKTEDLVPPKGIVNSAQLEMEVMRVFANAVMFNPLPPSERGIPPEFRMVRDRSTLNNNNKDENKKSRKSKSIREDGGGGGGGGAAAAAAAADDDWEEEDTEADKKGYALAAEDEGGIVQDTREMFESVEKSVAQWRSVEQRYIDDVPRSGAGGVVGSGQAWGGGLGLRGGSVSDLVVAEESGQEDGEREKQRERDVGVGSMGGMRKRRRVME